MRHAGLRELNFRFEFEGSKVVFDIVSRDGRLAHLLRNGEMGQLVVGEVASNLGARGGEAFEIRARRLG
jgi:hypothetical protein